MIKRIKIRLKESRRGLIELQKEIQTSILRVIWTNLINPAAMTADLWIKMRYAWHHQADPSGCVVRLSVPHAGICSRSRPTKVRSHEMETYRGHGARSFGLFSDKSPRDRF